MSPAMGIGGLTCERRVAPLGIDVPAPRLAWSLYAAGRDRRQTAYEIRVGSTPGAADFWSSGKVASDESAGVAYAGRPLASSEWVYWQVRVWDETNRATPYSRASTWTSGVLRREDWKARWIGHSGAQPETLLVRREFAVRPGLRRAIVQITGVGQYEMRLNGQKVGEDLLAPGWTDYRKTVLYDTYDVTRLMKVGANAAGVFLGNGMDHVHGPRYTKFTGTFGPQRTLAQIRLDYADGTVDTIASDRTWTTHAGAITFSSVFGGEDYDLRLEPKGWAKPGFREGGWYSAEVCDGPGGVLRGSSESAPPIREVEVLKSKSRRSVGPDAEVVDLGQNASCMVRLWASGPAGSSVRVIPAELLKPDGTVDRRSSGGGDAWWQVTLDGSKTTYFPKFFYHGCRYLQIERRPAPGGGRPTVEKVEGVVVHSSAPAVGRFACSNDLFNRTHEIVRWAQRSNLMSVVTDCPHRERLGWLEVPPQRTFPTLRARPRDSIREVYARHGGRSACHGPRSRHRAGVRGVRRCVPRFARMGQRGRARSVAAVSLSPGPLPARRALRDDEALVEYLRTTAKDGIVSHGLGDWYDIGPGEPGPSKNTPMPLTATAFYFQDATILAQVAALLGRKEDATRFGEESEKIKAAFNRRFFDSAKGFYATGSQTSSAIPLVIGLVAPKHREAVLVQLVRDIRDRGNAVTAGDVGYRYVLRALAMVVDPTLSSR